MRSSKPCGKWKTNPTFSTWLEVQDPIHRHSWTPVDLHKTNIFDHYDFNNQIPDPLTRERAETDPSYMVPRVKTLRENDFFNKKDQATPMSMSIKKQFSAVCRGDKNNKIISKT